MNSTDHCEVEGGGGPKWYPRWGALDAGERLPEMGSAEDGQWTSQYYIPLGSFNLMLFLRQLLAFEAWK